MTKKPNRYRDKQVVVRCTKEEREEIMSYAKEKNLNVYEVVFTGLRYAKLKEKEEKIRKMLEEDTIG